MTELAFRSDPDQSREGLLEAEPQIAEKLTELDLNKFTGPLDLLNYLLEEFELPLEKISIAYICDYYIAIIESNKGRIDLTLATDFLLVAAQLIQLKSRLLLPVLDLTKSDESEDDGPDNLIFQLLAFRRNKLLAQELELRHYKYRLCNRFNQVEPELLDLELEQRKLRVSREKLEKAIALLQVQSLEKFNSNQAKFRRILKLDEYSVADKLAEIWARIGDGKTYSFRQLLEDPDSLGEKLVVFLAILELLRGGKIRARQSKAFADIYISREKGLEGLLDLEQTANK